MHCCTDACVCKLCFSFGYRLWGVLVESRRYVRGWFAPFLFPELESFSSDVAELKRHSDALRCRAIAEARLQGCWLPKWQGRPWSSKLRISRWSSILLTSFDILAPSQQCRLDFSLRKCWWSDVFSLSAANWLRLTSATDAWSARGIEDRSALPWFILIYQLRSRYAFLGLPSSKSHTGDNFYCSEPLSERIKMAKVQAPRHEDNKIWRLSLWKGFKKLTDEWWMPFRYGFWSSKTAKFDSFL